MNERGAALRLPVSGVELELWPDYFCIIDGNTSCSHMLWDELRTLKHVDDKIHFIDRQNQNILGIVIQKGESEVADDMMRQCIAHWRAYMQTHRCVLQRAVDRFFERVELLPGGATYEQAKQDFEQNVVSTN